MSRLEGNVLFLGPDQFARLKNLSNRIDPADFECELRLFGCTPRPLGSPYEVVVCRDWRSFALSSQVYGRSTDKRKPRSLGAHHG